MRMKKRKRKKNTAERTRKNTAAYNGSTRVIHVPFEHTFFPLSFCLLHTLSLSLSLSLLFFALSLFLFLSVFDSSSFFFLFLFSNLPVPHGLSAAFVRRFITRNVCLFQPRPRYHNYIRDANELASHSDLQRSNNAIVDVSKDARGHVLSSLNSRTYVHLCIFTQLSWSKLCY